VPPQAVRRSFVVAMTAKRHWVIGSAAIGVMAVALVAIFLARQSDLPVWRTLPPPAALPTADESGLAPVDDIQMFYAIFNKDGGSPVLLIHGGLSNAETWGNQVPVLARNHEVIVAESRGHGRSTRSNKPFSYQLMADDYVGLLDHLRIDEVALVGWSDGGIIGLDMAMRYPQRLSKLWAYGANISVAGLKDGFDKDPVFSAAITLQGKQYERLSPTPKEYGAFVAAISQMWNTQPDYKPEQLATITTPTMIVDGEYDEAIKREHTEEIARLVPGAKLLIIPGISHFGHWQNPELYNKELAAFLDGQ
jgi:pimeloyl-ACP methyl ester carboxylesterase